MRKVSKTQANSAPTKRGLKLKESDTTEDDSKPENDQSTSPTEEELNESDEAESFEVPAGWRPVVRLP